MATERREFPRAALSEAAEVALVSHTTVEVRTVNISRVGVQLETDEATRDDIFPQGQPTTPGSRPQLTVRFVLDGAPEAVRIEAKAEAVLYRRIGANRFRIGVPFLNFRGDAFSALERYVYAHGR